MVSSLREPPILLRRPGTPVGAVLRAWREQRRRSQLDLALDAEVSQRHLSFVENGRASPSREMVLRLAETLDVPLRERNALLLAAGFAPVYGELPLDDPSMRAARDIVETILRSHAPNPALAVDRHWRLVAANSAVAGLLARVKDQALLVSPINVLRLSLHPGGLAPDIVNLPEWRSHVLERVRREAQGSGDPAIAQLLSELTALGGGGPQSRTQGATTACAGIATPLEIDTAEGRLSLISTTTVFGTLNEVALSELAIEAFYPADQATAERLARLHRTASDPATGDVVHADC